MSAETVQGALAEVRRTRDEWRSALEDVKRLGQALREAEKKCAALAQDADAAKLALDVALNAEVTT